MSRIPERCSSTAKTWPRSKEARKRINYLSHYNAIPEEMTVRGALDFYARIEGGRTDEVIALLNLEDLKDRKVSDLSQGQKKRVSIAKVFLRERDLYLLDEPTSNLDPGVSKEIRDILLRLSKDRIVLYSSHNLYEARDVGTNLILVRDGTIGYFDKISNIRSKEYRVGIRTTTDISKMVDAKLGEGGYYVLSVSTPEEAGLALKKLVENGVLVTEMRQLDNPLQDLFEGHLRPRRRRNEGEGEFRAELSGDQGSNHREEEHLALQDVCRRRNLHGRARRR